MHFTVEAQNIAKQFLSLGAIAIDATAGNGFDTLFLAEAVGQSGRVYAFDVQTTAIDIVRGKLEEANLKDRCRCMVQSHALLRDWIDQEHFGKISVVMFNLGYLPFGDKSIVTNAESTLAALDQSLELVRAGGLISVLAYPGHAGGIEEAQAVEGWIERQQSILKVDRYQDLQNAKSPILWCCNRIRKNSPP